MDDSREFKINLSADEAEETELPPRSKPQKPAAPIKHIRGWIVTAGIAIILITGGLYHILNIRIQALNAQGSAGIASLSEETTAKLDEFSTLIAHQTAQLQVQTEEFGNRLKKIDASLAALQSGKTDKKEMAAAIAQISDTLKPMQASMAAWDEKLGTIAEEARLLKEDIEQTRADMGEIRKEIGGFRESYLDRTQFAEEMKKEREFNQQNMAHASETLFSEMAAMNQRLKDIEKRMDQVNAPKAAKGKARTSQEAPLDNVTPRPGEIIEQEIPAPEKSQP